MRSEVTSFLEAKVGARPYKDEPMDVESMAKGQDKGKGKDRKDSTAKGRGKGTEKHDSIVNFEGYCSNPDCGKWDHRWTDCWKERGGAHGKGKDKGEGNSKDKQGKSKGKGNNANSIETGKNWSEPEQQNLQQAVPQTAGPGSLGLCSLGNGRSITPTSRGTVGEDS